MKNKENIFEELNKMRNLIVAKAGTVISEQTNLSGDVGAIMQELNKFNSDESKIVNIIKKFTTKDAFQNFVNQYKTISGKDFGVDLIRAIKLGDDNKEINDIRSHLEKFGVGFNLGRAGWELSGLSSTSQSFDQLQKNEESWRTTNSCVPSQPGAIATKLSDGTTAYKIGDVVYYGNGRKKLADGKMDNYNCSTEFKGGRTRGTGTERPSGASVGTRFSDSAKSLGIQNAKMDLQTLQTMLKSLEGETTTAAAPTQGTPDIAQLTAVLQQLQA